MSQPKWKQFEQVIAKIHRDLIPGATIEHNVKLIGKSGIKRQIDVLVDGMIGGGYLYRMIVECKRYKRRVSVGMVDSVIGKKADVNADIAVIVSASGFTKGAIERAKSAGIRTMTAKIASRQDWSEFILPWLRLIDYKVVGLRSYIRFLDGQMLNEVGLSPVDRPVFITPEGDKLTDFQIFEREWKNHNVKLIPGIVKHEIPAFKEFILIKDNEEVELSFFGVEYTVIAQCYEGVFPVREGSYISKDNNGQIIHYSLEFELPTLTEELDFVCECQNEGCIKDFETAVVPGDRHLHIMDIA